MARVSGPVWSSLPQTPQAAENVALGAAAEITRGASTVYDDCANVVREFYRPMVSRLSGKRPYAGVMKYMTQWLGYRATGTLMLRSRSEPTRISAASVSLI